MGVGGRSRGPGLGSAQAGGAAPRTPGPVPPQEVRGGPYSLRTKRVEDVSGETQLHVPGAECTSSRELCAGSLGPTFPAE